MSGSYTPRPVGIALVGLVVTTLISAQAHAAPDLSFSVDLRTGVADSPLPPYITFAAPLADAN
jgi:hypothetical protein